MCWTAKSFVRWLSSSVKYYPKDNHLQALCLCTKTKLNKCHILDWSRSPCNSAVPPGRILSWRLFSCKVCSLCIANANNHLDAPLKEGNSVFQMLRKYVLPKGLKAGEQRLGLHLYSKTYFCSNSLYCVDVNLHFCCIFTVTYL